MKKTFTKQLFLSAFFALFSMVGFSQDIVITEIMYNPPEGGQDSVEYIELFNAGSSNVDLTGWEFTAGVELSFPTTMLAAGDYLVVAKNDTAFQAYFGFLPMEWTDGSLKNGGEMIKISNANGVVVDSVEYTNVGDWPSAAAGEGTSLVLCDAASDNFLASSWLACTTSSGFSINGKEVFANPGAASGCPTGIVINADDYFTATDVARVLDVLDNDVLVGVLSSVVVSTPKLGTVTVLASNKIEYTPPAGQCAVQDSFLYTVTMEDGQTGSGVVLIDILCAPEYSIGLVTTVDANGKTDSLDVICTLKGIVYGVDMIGSAGIQFTMIDANGDGVAVRRGDMDLGYTVTEGDEVTVVGMVDQYNGLTQFSAGKITKNSAGNDLLAATIVTQLGEDTESKLIKLENMYVVDMAKWSDSGSGFNIKITNGGVDTIAVRIDKDVDAYGNATLKSMVDGAKFNLTGIGAQYDNSSPYTGGYQLFPRYTADFDIITAVNTPSLQNQISIYPNPATTDFVVATRDLEVDEIKLVNALGQVLNVVSSPEEKVSISLEAYAKGLYFLQITAGNAFTTMMIEKN